MSELERFKLDALVIREDKDNFLAVLHFNVPVNYLGSVEIAPRLETINQLVREEFGSEIAKQKVFVSATATYELVHRLTGQTMLWRGSFQPRNNQDFYIIPSQVFNPGSFVETFSRQTSPETVSARVRIRGMNTEWQLSELKSLIVSFTADCSFANHRLGPRRIVIPPSHHGPVGRKQLIVYPFE